MSTLTEEAVMLTFDCSAGGCTAKMSADVAFVPDLKSLYLTQRGTKIDRANPLTVQEVAECVRCRRHRNDFSGIARTYPLKGTLGLLDHWAAENEAPRRYQEKLQAERAAKHAEHTARHLQEKQARAEKRAAERAAHAPRPVAAPRRPKKYGDERKFDATPVASKKSKKQLKKEAAQKKQK